MIHLFLLILVLLLPVYSEAAYKIFLKNGSVISGVSSFEKKGRGGHCLFQWRLNRDI